MSQTETTVCSRNYPSCTSTATPLPPPSPSSPMQDSARIRTNTTASTKKSQPLNLSSELKFLLLITTATSSTHNVISEPFVEAAVFVSIWISDRDSRDAVTSRSNELSLRLGRILAAIMGTNRDSVRKIPARHKGIVKIKKIPARQKGLVFQNKQIVLLSGGRLAEFAMAKESLTVARPQEVFKVLQLKLLAYLVLVSLLTRPSLSSLVST